jgi:hypothetical protein
MGAGFPRLRKLQRYRLGDAPIAEEADPAQREAVARFLNMQRLQFAEQIVTSSFGRIRPYGFRTAAPSDANGDPIAQSIFNENHLAVTFRDMLDDAATYGAAYLTVSRLEPNSIEIPVITKSNEWTTYGLKNPMRPWMFDAVIQIGYDAVVMADYIVLMRPGYARRAIKPTTRSTIPTDGTSWRPGTDWTWESGPQATSWTADIPVTPFETPHRLGEFEQHIDSLDRINHTILQRLIITAMQAFRQRGIAPQKDGEGFPEFYPQGHPQAGQRIDYNDIYKATPAALWFLPKGAEVWESAITDIRPILEAVTADLKHLAGASSTPIYVLSPDAANGSAEGASLARETNIQKQLDRRDRYSPQLSRTLGYAFRAMGDETRSLFSQIDTLWAPMNFTSDTEKAAAARDAKQGGMSTRGVNERIWGMTPSELVQEAIDASADAFATGFSDGGTAA